MTGALTPSPSEQAADGTPQDGSPAPDGGEGGAVLDDAVVDAIAESIRERACILFLGAGIHAGPPAGSRFVYDAAARPPLGTELSRHLAAECDLTTKHPGETGLNLGRTSLFYETEKSRQELVESLRTAVQDGKQPSPVLRGLAAIGFPLVITTNYDKLLESALFQASRVPNVKVYASDSTEPTADYPGEPSPERPFVFKIHGDIDDGSSIVITDEDYIQFILRMTDQRPYYPLPETIRFRLTKWTTLFLGYSLLDYDLRLLFKTLRWKVDESQFPPVYSVDIKPDPLIVAIYYERRRYVKFISQDVWMFVPELYRRVLGKEMPHYRD